MHFKHKLNYRLECLIKKSGININQLHKHTGIPLSTLKRLRLNKENNPTLASLAPIADYFSVTLDQLTGIADLPENLGNSEKISGLTIPLIHWEDIINMPKDRRRLAFASVLIMDVNLNENSYALLVKDKNWNNFLVGSLLIVDPDLIPRDRDFVIVNKKGLGAAQLKQTLIYDNKKFLKNFKSKIITFSEKYKSLGVVIQIKMNYKKSSAYVDFEDEKNNRTKKY